MKKQIGPGMVIPHTPLSVDCWRTSISRPLYYFCTHAHTDHLVGLQPSWSHPIYCSGITAKLLMARFGLKKELLGVLDSNSPTMVGNFTVTALDANHCPGSVMFLFEGPFGTILHTGDFRFTPSIHLPLHPALRGEKHVDMLYLDNTYCNPNCVFPSREEAAEKVIDFVRLADPTYQRVHILTYNLGKEDLLVRVAKTMNVPIVVSASRMESLMLLDLPSVFTTDEESHIHAHTVAEAGNLQQRLLGDWKGDVVIQPTALRLIKPQDRAAGTGSVDGCYMVPYSDHSPYKELQEFVSTVRPSQVRGILDVEQGGKYFSCDGMLRSGMLQGEDGSWSPGNPSSTPDIAVAKGSSPRLIAMAHGFKRRPSHVAMLEKRVCYEEEQGENLHPVQETRGAMQRSKSFDIRLYSAKRNDLASPGTGDRKPSFELAPESGAAARKSHRLSLKSLTGLFPSTSEAFIKRLAGRLPLCRESTSGSEDDKRSISGTSFTDMMPGDGANDDGVASTSSGSGLSRRFNDGMASSSFGSPATLLTDLPQQDLVDSINGGSSPVTVRVEDDDGPTSQEQCESSFCSSVSLPTSSWPSPTEDESESADIGLSSSVRKASRLRQLLNSHSNPVLDEHGSIKKTFSF